MIKKGVIDPSAVDPNMLEGERQRVLSIERLVLETLCFKFSVDVGLDLVVKIGRAFHGELLSKFVPRVMLILQSPNFYVNKLGESLLTGMLNLLVCTLVRLISSHRSHAPLSFPPHVIALSSLYTASVLLLENAHPHTEYEGGEEEQRGMVKKFGNAGPWEASYHTSKDQIDGKSPHLDALPLSCTQLIVTDVTHALLDLYITILSIPISDPAFLSSPSTISPKEIGATQPSTSSQSGVNTAFRIPTFWTSQTLTELKIHLRDRRPGSIVLTPWVEGDEVPLADASDGLGQNVGTVRFLWDEAEMRSSITA